MSPAACVLDPDGRIVRHLAATGRGVRDPDWDCFHTELWTTPTAAGEIGVVAYAVGAPWAVLVADRLVGAGCELLVSVAPALPVGPTGPLPHLVLIDRALRDEPTSSRGRPPARWSRLDVTAAAGLHGAFDHLPIRVRTGTSWSTAAPHRAFATALARDDTTFACVDTDAAALYAFGEERAATVACLAHLDGATTVSGTDVTWGPGVPGEAALAVAAAAAAALDPTRAAATPATRQSTRS